MESDAFAPSLITSYSPQYVTSVPLVPLALVLAGAILFRLVRASPEQRWISVGFIVVSGLLLGMIFTILSFQKLQSVDVTSVGTVDFVYRARRESFPLSQLTQITGYTSRSQSPTRSSYNWFILFTLQEIGQAPVEKRAHIIESDLPLVQEFVRRLELASPRADATDFWQWSRTVSDPVVRDQ